MNRDVLDKPLRNFKGVGDRRAALLERLGLFTLEDVLRFYPRAYEDWSSPVSIQDAPLGEACCVKAAVLTEPAAHFVRKGMTLYKFDASDGGAVLKVTIFNNKYLASRIRKGSEYLFYGQISAGFTKREMASPLIEPAEGGQRIRPLYRQTEGLPSRVLEHLAAQAVREADGVLEDDPIPSPLREKHSLCTRRFALENIHFPTGKEALALARRRLVFEELLVLQLGLLRLKGRSRGENTRKLEKAYSREYLALLPFALTGAQRRALGDCLRDMMGEHPMNRLIQGDVGSGKTAVAAGAAWAAVRNGMQVALMAPTEILAEQHARTLTKLLEPGGVRVGLLTGSQPAAVRRQVREALAAGEVDLIAGTHALLSENVEFRRLGLVVTDEQHRFGVSQRARLAAKGDNPHILVMSATPIPRTLALILYGDLDVSVLDELPPGRLPVATYAIGGDKRERAFRYVKKHLDAGRQAYIVCPLVEGDGESDLASATEYAEALSHGAFRGYSLGLLHGRMKPADKERVMTAFARGEIAVLVSTTVIEVGVDVPNAVLMVIENAERFGLAQLHQLRGRVGRGAHRSTCILISDAQNEEAVRRLQVLCSTNDGFRIADEDLKQRGPGDFFGSRQHGLPDLKIADLMGDMPLFQEAQDAARRLLDGDAALSEPAHRGLADEVKRLFSQVGEQGMN